MYPVFMRVVPSVPLWQFVGTQHAWHSASSPTTSYHPHNYPTTVHHYHYHVPWIYFKNFYGTFYI